MERSRCCVRDADSCIDLLSTPSLSQPASDSLILSKHNVNSHGDMTLIISNHTVLANTKKNSFIKILIFSSSIFSTESRHQIIYFYQNVNYHSDTDPILSNFTVVINIKIRPHKMGWKSNLVDYLSIHPIQLFQHYSLDSKYVL